MGLIKAQRVSSDITQAVSYHCRLVLCYCKTRQNICSGVTYSLAMRRPCRTAHTTVGFTLESALQQSGGNAGKSVMTEGGHSQSASDSTDDVEDQQLGYCDSLILFTLPVLRLASMH